VTCVHFLNSCGLFVVQRQHLLVQGTACAPPLAQFTLIVFKSARTVLGSVGAALLLLFARLASCECTFWPAHQGQPKPRPPGAFKIFVLFMHVCAWVAGVCVSVMNNDMHCVTAWEWAWRQGRGNSSKLVRNSNRCKIGVVTIDFDRLRSIFDPQSILAEPIDFDRGRSFSSP
jgi:hypothetical protein